MRPLGWTEISAVCTDPAFRGRGLATRLVAAVGAVIRARGDVPFLHTTQDNATAIGVYEVMGFVRRRSMHFAAYRVPE
jgi:predicted GNAT family acetyltransferase